MLETPLVLNAISNIPIYKDIDTSNFVLISLDGSTDISVIGFIQSLQLIRDERVQSVACFNDYVHVFPFGHDTMRGNLTGVANKDAIGKIQLNYKDTYRAYHAKPVNLTTTVGNMKVIMIKLAIQTNADNPVLCTFSMDFISLEDDDNILNTYLGA